MFTCNRFSERFGEVMMPRGLGCGAKDSYKRPVTPCRVPNACGPG